MLLKKKTFQIQSNKIQLSILGLWLLLFLLLLPILVAKEHFLNLIKNSLSETS